MPTLAELIRTASRDQSRRAMSHSPQAAADTRPLAVGALLGASMVPGAGVTDAAGYFPSPDGGFEPSLPQNVREGSYLQAALQALGVGGDALMGLGPAGAALGMAAKAPRAASLARRTAASAAEDGASPRALSAAARRMMRDALPADTDLTKYLARPTVTGANNVAYPDIYMRPDELVARAKVAPEDPAMRELFGVNRDDLFQMADEGRRQGNITERPFQAGAKARGAASAEGVMNRRNEGRILDIIEEARKNPDLYKGMASWYTMDPAYQRMVELVGTDEAKKAYERFNSFTGMASPGSEVLTEMNRGTGAMMLANQGRFDDFVKFGGVAERQRGADFPPDMAAITPHPYHKTAHSGPMSAYVERGNIGAMQSAKVPSYIAASGVPETGFQTRWPVGDAHWSRLVGLPDTRGQTFDKKTGMPGPNTASASVPEMVSLGPWWEQKIAREAGLESVPAQAVVWGAGSNATGVTSPIGAPKLELLSQQIMKTAKRLGISPQEARDRVLMGKAHAGFADPRLLAAMAGAGAGGGYLLSGEQEP
jgi:hypothetical protein